MRNYFRKMTTVMMIHYVRLLYRGALFLAMLALYIHSRLITHGTVISMVDQHPLLIGIVWIVYFVEMVFRFFPSRLESPGCQKQYAKNYVKTGSTDVAVQDGNATMLVCMIWIAFNGVFGGLHMLNILDDDFMLLLCCAYSVCDVICILFFCPFQTWFFKNKCCSTCRIYNWDYAMMFTPLLFVKKTYTLSLLILAFGLLLRWEITFFRAPERFSPSTNGYLSCANCTEKLCRHKKQLQPLWKRIDAYTRERIRKLRGVRGE